MFCKDWKRTKNHLCRTIASGVCKRSKHSCCFIAKKRNSRRSVRGVIGILSLRYKKIKESFVQHVSWAWVVAFVPKIHVIRILSLQLKCKNIKESILFNNIFRLWFSLLIEKRDSNHEGRKWREKWTGRNIFKTRILWRNSRQKSLHKVTTPEAMYTLISKLYFRPLLLGLRQHHPAGNGLACPLTR